MFYSDELIQEVISANDIEDVISAYVRLKKSGRNSMGLCPFHNEKTPSFHVSADKQLYHCFGCGEGGTVINFIMKAENLDFVDALKWLAQRANITLPEPEQSPQVQKNARKKQRMLSANNFAGKFFYNTLVKSPDAQKGRDYVISRGLQPKTITSFGIGYAPENGDLLIRHLEEVGYTKQELYDFGLAVIKNNRYVDKFRGRVMFPIIDVRGNVIG
ncbi:MAG: DNA primase, partial [Clostridia bacterium]|nr:DNA primase [Clostridia bacterium]